MAGEKRATFPVGICEVNIMYTRDGNCPAQGVHTLDDSLFIGNYSSEEWNSDAIKPYHRVILKARTNSGKGNGNNFQSRSVKCRTNAVKRNKRKLKKLKEQISVAKDQISAIQATRNQNDDATAEPSFGGRRSMRE